MTIEKWAQYSTTLLPCPFCGSEPWGIFGTPEEDFIVECHGEDCGNWHHCAETKEETAQAWNRRASVLAQGTVEG